MQVQRKSGLVLTDQPHLVNLLENGSLVSANLKLPAYSFTGGDPGVAFPSANYLANAGDPSLLNCEITETTGTFTCSSNNGDTFFGCTGGGYNDHELTLSPATGSFVQGCSRLVMTATLL